MIRDPFKPTFREEYEMALREGDRRFGSECKHEHVKNGRCTQCLRVVVTRRRAA